MAKATLRSVNLRLPLRKPNPIIFLLSIEINSYFKNMGMLSSYSSNSSCHMWSCIFAVVAISLGSSKVLLVLLRNTFEIFGQFLQLYQNSAELQGGKT